MQNRIKTQMKIHFWPKPSKIVSVCAKNENRTKFCLVSKSLCCDPHRHHLLLLLLLLLCNGELPVITYYSLFLFVTCVYWFVSRCTAICTGGCTPPFCVFHSQDGTTVAKWATALVTALLAVANSMHDAIPIGPLSSRIGLRISNN